MKKTITFLLMVIVLLTGSAFASRPQAILGPGAGGVNFRFPYHETTHRVLSADTTYILTGWYFIDSTYSITIPAGTVIRGDSASAGTLIIKRGAQIFAEGTALHPIVFTTNDASGSRAPGDWGGVIILGASTTNKPSTQQIEGGFGSIPNTDAMYGGANPNDNSGIFRYVRIEFPGIAYAVNNEINGLTLGAVGSGTTVDHIQVSFSGDDDFEWFGGTVNAKYLIGWRGTDDNFDTDFGFSGKIQYGYAKRDPNKFDGAGQSNGFESDNEASAPFSATPRTKPVFSNMTLVGPQNDTTTSVNSRWEHSGILRRSTETSIYNSVMMGWPFGLNIKDTLTSAAAANDLLQVRNTSLQAKDGSKTLYYNSSPTTASYAGWVIKNWFETAAYGNNGSTPRNAPDLGLPSAVFNLDATNNPVPTGGSEPAVAGTSYQGRLSGDTWFDSVGYRGAFDPTKSRSEQWDANWANYDPENYDPEALPIPTDVEFRVNMKVKAKEGLFNPSEDYVLVRGSFNGWGEADTLTDGNGDSIYTKNIANFNPGDTINFKFYYRDVSASQDNWENDPNRTYAIPTTDSYYQAYFNNDSLVSLPVTVYFAVNMELERLSGRFTPGDDTVSVNGSFNGWAAKTTILNPNPLNTDVYEGSAVVVVSPGDKIFFKFWYEDNNWENNFATPSTNREKEFSQASIDSSEVYYRASFNDGSLETVINQPCIVKFTVYMPGAISAISSNPFPVVNSVSIAGSALPLQWPNGGWPDTDSNRMLRLYDDGTNGDLTAGDGIYSLDVTFPAYTSLQPQYKYGANYGDAVNNEGGNDNEYGFGSNHILNLTRYMTSVTTVDTFGVMGTSHLKYPGEYGSTITNLSTGWNMVSVPRNVSNFAKTALFPTATSFAFKYNAGYTTADTLAIGAGYWVKYGSAVSDTFSGSAVAYAEFNVTAGWNMIGSISSSIPVGTISSNPGGIVTSQFFEYNNGYSSAASIEPGKGYWVKTSASGKLILATSMFANAKNAIRIIPSQELPPSPPHTSYDEAVPSVYALDQNYPNPFNPTTVINYSIMNDGIVTLKVFNLLGQEVATLLNGEQMAQGAHQATFSGSSLSSGVYYYKLTVQDIASGAVTFRNTRTMVLVK